MRKFIGVFFMLAGLAMVFAAGWLLYMNSEEETQAGSSSEIRLEELKIAMQATPTPAPVTDATPSPTPLPMETPVPEMPTMEIDGEEYIGYLELPTIGLSLPVMSDWDYEKLKTAPCRYWGSAYDNTMVILAHNYRRHFSLIHTLEIGAPVQFVDVDGDIYRYVVAAQETLEPDEVQEMVDNEYDLTLFTCTYGGASRVTVRLKRVTGF